MWLNYYSVYDKLIKCKGSQFGIKTFSPGVTEYIYNIIVDIS